MTDNDAPQRPGAEPAQAADTASATDASRLISSLRRDKVTLELRTVELCFLAALYMRADRASLASFEEDQLVDVFEQVCNSVDPGAENVRKRATHTIHRLREQRMLSRVDGAGIVRAGEYTLSRLAAAVVDYFLTDEKLTRESLTLLTGTLSAKLAEILAGAKQARTEADWRAHVIGPLSVTVAELVSGIERRQRGLDADQEQVQAEIARLLSASWSSAVDSCQELLDSTTRTLHELNQILMRETTQLATLLQEIQSLASAAGNSDAEAAAQKVIEHVDRIQAWGNARQGAWTEYYQYVHRYLRDVVRLDPDRALSQRLRDQIARWPKRPFHLLTAHAPSISLLRPMEARVERPPVERPRSERDAAPAWVDPDSLVIDIDALVAQALAQGAVTLAEVSRRVLPALPEPLRYAGAGRIADAVLRETRARREHERPWTGVMDALEIEDWVLRQGQEP